MQGNGTRWLDTLLLLSLVGFYMDFFFPHLALAIIAFTPICTYNCDAGICTAGTLAFLSKRGHLLWNMPCAASGRRCGSAAYLSDAGTTSAAGPTGSSSLQSLYYYQTNQLPNKACFIIKTKDKLFSIKLNLIYNRARKELDYLIILIKKVKKVSLEDLEILNN
jgi:hypothetical protein